MAFKPTDDTEFTCPECGSHEFGTSNCRAPFEEMKGHCNGVREADAPGYAPRRCTFTWARKDDEKYFKVVGPRLGERRSWSTAELALADRMRQDKEEYEDELSYSSEWMRQLRYLLEDTPVRGCTSKDNHAGVCRCKRCKALELVREIAQKWDAARKTVVDAEAAVLEAPAPTRPCRMAFIAKHGTSPIDHALNCECEDLHVPPHVVYICDRPECRMARKDSKSGRMLAPPKNPPPAWLSDPSLLPKKPPGRR